MTDMVVRRLRVVLEARDAPREGWGAVRVTVVGVFPDDGADLPVSPPECWRNVVTVFEGVAMQAPGFLIVPTPPVQAERQGA